MKHHARRIRKLSVSASDEYHPFILALDANRDTRFLFSNLRAISIQNIPSTVPVRHYEMFLSPSLIKCTLYEKSGTFSEVPAIIQLLPTLCPRLQNLSLLSQYTAQVEAILAVSLSSLRGLTTLFLHGPLTPSLAIQLGLRCSELRDVSFFITSTICSLPRDPLKQYSNSLFPKLEELSIHGEDFEDCCALPISLIRAIKSDKFSSFAFHQIDLTSDDDDLRALLSALGNHTNMQYINLDVHYCDAEVDYSTLRLLRNLRRLDCFLMPLVSISLRPEDIKHLGEMWPRLRDLHLWPHGSRHTLDLQDLPLFALHLPHLQSLCMPFTSTTYFRNGIAIPDNHPVNGQLRWLSPVAEHDLENAVGEDGSGVWDHTDEVAGYISAIFPNAKLDYDVVEVSVECLDLWKAVGREMGGV